MFTGYHYTSLECWRKIEKDGLVPYTIKRPILEQYIGTESAVGVWVWLEKLTGISHAGSIIYQMAMKGVQEVVLLELDYDQDDCLTPEADTYKYLVLPHNGTIENLEYHKGGDRAVIVTKTIPTEQIKLIGQYNLAQAWEGI